MAQILNAQTKGSLDVLDDAVCAIGVFDGVHLGHQSLIEGARKQAHDSGRPFVIITFDIDPDEFFKSGTEKIMTNKERLSFLSTLCDSVLVIKFDKELASLEPDQFLDRFFLDNKPHDIYVGEDFRFGKMASGDVDTLDKWGSENGVVVHPVPLLYKGGQAVKSTRIRSLLSSGNIEAAHKLLGHSYSLEGVVRHGRGEGTDMGIQTANLFIPSDELALGEGVYAGYVVISDTRYKAAVSVGVSPTFENATENIEVHILDFDGDLYDRTIKVEFVEYLRPMITFDSIDDLIATVKSNIEYIRTEL